MIVESHASTSSSGAVPITRRISANRHSSNLRPPKTGSSSSYSASSFIAYSTVSILQYTTTSSQRNGFERRDGLSSKLFFNTSRQSRNNANVKHYFALLYVLFMCVIESAQAATFFYGATQNEMMSTVDAAQNLVGIEQAARLNQDQLKDIYKFCQYLPILIEAGHIPRGSQSTEICKNIVSLLGNAFQPILNKRDGDDATESATNGIRQKRSTTTSPRKPQRRLLRRRHTLI